MACRSFALVRAGALARWLGLAAALGLAPASAEEARGVADPVVSWGLAGLSDWGTASPFLDIGRLMRPFFGFSGGDWKTQDHADLAAAGLFDAAGYPVRVPRGLTGFRTVWDWPRGPSAAQRTGLYILSYAGTGRIELGGAAKVVAEAPGRMVFENPRGTRFWLDITATDPANRGDHIRDISVIRADRAALVAAGAVFDPGWLALVRDARELRFMDWMRTNDSPVTWWSDRPVLADASWSARGAPVEIMVRLANEAGADPWFTMPHAADDDYVRRFATLVRDMLDPRLKAHVEYSNEIWNRSFGQAGWLRDAAVASWGPEVAEDRGALADYHAKRATEVALIWKDVFGDEADARVVNVLGSQTVNPWLSERLLEAPQWAARDTEGYVPPAEVFEELAVTTYFGGGLVRSGDLRAELLARASSSQMRLYGWLFERLALESEGAGSVPATLAALEAQKEIAGRHGLRLVLYEGGQHVHHSFGVGSMDEDQARALAEVLEGFVRSPEMGALYAQLWDGWARLGDGPFMQFVEMSAPSRWGSWGLLAHRGDRTPRADLVLSRQARGGSWWGEGGGPQYLYGIVAEGTEGADRLEGTPEEDYLLGGGGDDVFVASAGNDGINGGAGTDTFLLPGPPGDYEIAAEGDGYRVTGATGSTYLIDVERLEFGDGSTRTLD